MRAFVTGGAGFIGSYLVPALLDRGVEILVMDKDKNPSLLLPVINKIQYIRGDLSFPSDIYRVMLSHSFDEVIHLGSVLAEPCEENPLLGFQINFLSTLILLEASVSCKIHKFLMTSSISVFGRGITEPVADDEKKNPANIYGQTKLACEHLLQWYAIKHGIDTRAVRFPWVFGPGRTTGITAQYSSLLLDKIARGEKVEIENPEERGDWLYVKDAVKALLSARDAVNPVQRIYNISGGVHSIREVIEIANKIKPEATVKYLEGRSSVSPYPIAYDDSAARREIGWKPDYSIEKAVKEHVEIVSRQKA